MLRTSLLRGASLPSSTIRAGAAQLTPLSQQISQRRQAHAISNPTLANIEKRWEAMPPQEQADLWMQLRDRMKVDWNELTMQEKKAGRFKTPAAILSHNAQHYDDSCQSTVKEHGDIHRGFFVWLVSALTMALQHTG